MVELTVDAFQQAERSVGRPLDIRKWPMEYTQSDGHTEWYVLDTTEPGEWYSIDTDALREVRR